MRIKMVQYGKKFSIGIIRCNDDGTGFFIDRLFLWCLSQKHAGPSAGDPDMKDDESKTEVSSNVPR